MAGTVAQRYNLLKAGTALTNPMTAKYTAYDAAVTALTAKLARWQGYNADTLAACTELGLDTVDYTNITAAMSSTATKYQTYKARTAVVFSEFSQRMQLAKLYQQKLIEVGQADPAQAAYTNLVNIYGTTAQGYFNTLTPKITDLNTKFDTLDAALLAHPVTSVPAVPPATSPTLTVDPTVTAAITAVNGVITTTTTAITLLGTQVTALVTTEAPLVPDYLKAIGDAYLAKITPAWNTDSYIGSLLSQITTTSFKALL